MDRNELRRLLLFAAAVLVLFLVWLSYRPALSGAFIWDDHAFTQTEAGYRHARLGELMTRSFWPDSPFADARAPYYRPLVLLSYRLDLSLGGSPADFHFTNVALHLATCVLVGVTAFRAGASATAAMIAATLWGSFPRLTEAVAWVAGRTDVLAAFFGFAALALWPETGPAKLGRPSLWARSLFAGVLLFCACASKEVGLAFAGALLVTVVLRRGSRLRAAIALGVPIAAYFALRGIAFAHLEVPAARELGFGGRVLTVFEAIERYAEMTLDAFHPRTSIGMLGEPDGTRALVGVMIAIGAVVVAVAIVRRGSFGVRLALGLGGLAIAPVLQIVPLSLTSAVVADRLLYIPLAALAIGGAVLLSHRHRAVAAAAALILGALLCAATKARAAVYQEETAFWTTAAEHAHPHNTAPRMGLARWLYASGEPEVACPLYERSLAILTAEHLATRPPHRRAREGLAACWARIGRYDEAVGMNRELVHDFPTKARLFLELGFAELHVRNFDQAASAFAEASKLENGTLSRFVVSNAELTTIRTDAARYDHLDRLAQATHLADLGRAADAEAAFYAIATDESEPSGARQRATAYLMTDGSMELAERAYAVVPPPTFGWATAREETFARRRLVHRALLPLRSRIDALMR